MSKETVVTSPYAPSSPSAADMIRLSNIRESCVRHSERLKRLAAACADAAGDLASGPNVVYQDELDRRELAALRLLYSIENDEYPDTI